MINKVKVYLILILILVGAIPFFASYFVIKSFSNYQTEITYDLVGGETYKQQGEILKKLSRLDPEKKEDYRKSFVKLQEKRILIEEKAELLRAVKSSIGKVYFFFFGGFVLFVVLLGSILSRLISKIYQRTFEELEEKKERQAQLESFEKIAEIVKTLVHELKKPLAPIEIWNQNLKQAYLSKNENLGEVLDEAHKVTSDGVRSLKKYINSFNKYTSLPEPVLENRNVYDYLKGVINKVTNVYPEAKISLNSDQKEALFSDFDPNLLNQVFQNLIENAIEANPDKKIEIEFKLNENERSAFIDVHNSGAKINNKDKIFEFGFTTKNSKSNESRGFGLALSKISLLKQEGDLFIKDSIEGACFVVQLKRIPNLKEQK